MNEIPYGYCHCGCGEKTELYKQNCYVAKKECTRGEPKKFINAHVTRGENGQGLAWKGGKHIDSHGYVLLRCVGHPRGDKTSCVPEHILMCEKVLGKYLPPLAVVHHADENRSHNVNSNFVICQDSGYHQLLHKRTNAYKACGHADWEKCQYCKQHDKPENLIHEKRSKFHRKCNNAYRVALKSKTASN
jgi:hypothetical protein